MILMSTHKIGFVRELQDLECQHPPSCLYLWLLQMIDLLLDHGAFIDILDEQHRTPLHFAVVANRIPVINLLIARGRQYLLIQPFTK